MKGLDSMVRLMLRAQGTGLRWLREELQAANVRIRLTDGCLEELVRNADAAATRSSGRSYVERFRLELVRIARKYALPRRWKLSDPVVVEYRRKQPSYLQWTDDIDSGAVPQS